MRRCKHLALEDREGIMVTSIDGRRSRTLRMPSIAASRPLPER